MTFDFDWGRYAAYIWPAYVISAGVLGAMIALSLASARKWKAEAERLEAAAKAEPDTAP